MRLICPSCSAQYEVDDSVIPETGRDVQCSNCGHTWYQMPASHQDEADPPAAPSAQEAESGEGQSPDGARSRAEAISDIVAAEEDPNAEFYEEIIEEETVIGIITPGASLPEDEESPSQEDAEKAEAADEAALPKREVDPSVLSILREEAEEEIRQRQQEREQALPQSPDAADADEAAEGAIREIEALERGARPEEEDAGASRRDLLPDIEEVNSTLQADTATVEISEAEQAEAMALARTRRRRGWRLGFSLMLFLLALALILYAYADVLGARFPGLKPVLAAYVEQVNALRYWIDGLMERATAMLTDETAPPQN